MVLENPTGWTYSTASGQKMSGARFLVSPTGFAAIAAGY